MTDQANPLANRELFDARSSLLERLDDGLRAKINQAVIERRPGGYRAVYERFKLESHGVSFGAFYRYARRLRQHVAFVELGELMLPAAANVPEALPKLLAQRLMEALVLDDTSPRQLQRLADAYRIAASVQQSLRKNATMADRKAAANKDPLVRLLEQYAEIVTDDGRDENRNAERREHDDPNAETAIPEPTE